MKHGLMRRVLSVWMALALILVAAPVALAESAPERVVLPVSVLTLDLAEPGLFPLTATVEPAEASQDITWSSSSTRIVSVSASGRLRAKRVGSATITATAKDTKVQAQVKVTVKNSALPRSITTAKKTYNLHVGATTSIEPTVKPASADQTVLYESSKPSIASVSLEGVITAKKAGKAIIRLRSPQSTKIYRTLTVSVAKRPAPKKIIITPNDKTLNINEQLQLTTKVSPAAADDTVRWVSSDSKTATVSKDGLVTALKAGTVRITAVSTVKKTIKTARTLTIKDPYTLKGLKIKQESFFLDVGKTASLSVTLTPATAICEVTWTSSDPTVATISDNGTLGAKRAGSVTITASSGKYKSQINVAVLDTEHATALPARTTSIPGIQANVDKIEAIEKSVIKELTALRAKGTLSDAQFKNRKQAVENAFKMYNFPWLTTNRVNYWSSSAASKAFKPGIVYFGMPYTQRNRGYNFDKVIKGSYFRKTGTYYTMNASKNKSRTYTGNDCSSFVGMSIWGPSHSASYLRTRNIVKSSSYSRLRNANVMLPGDILCKSGVHTVMFLYYTNSAKTHMMIIEQGGGTEPNTVACRIKSVSSYVKNGYWIMRAKKF